jgi:hypothetical protein
MKKLLIIPLAVIVAGCSSTSISRTDNTGAVTTMTDHTFLVKRIDQDISALTETDWAFLTEWKVGSSTGDAEMVRAIYEAGVAAGKKAAMP